MRSGSELNRIVDGNAFDYRPDEARGLDLVSAFENFIQRPGFTTVEMVQGGDDSASSCLLDVAERNRVARSKPPPSFLHGSMLSHCVSHASWLRTFEAVVDDVNIA